MLYTNFIFRTIQQGIHYKLNMYLFQSDQRTSMNAMKLAPNNLWLSLRTLHHRINMTCDHRGGLETILGHMYWTSQSPHRIIGPPFSFHSQRILIGGRTHELFGKGIRLLCGLKACLRKIRHPWCSLACSGPHGVFKRHREDSTEQ